MIESIRGAVGKLNKIFQLSLEEFEEDVNFLRITKRDYLLGKIDVDELVSVISIFGESIKITLRDITMTQISGSDSKIALNDFFSWIEEQNQSNIQITIVVRKAALLKNMGVDENFGHVMFFKTESLMSRISYGMLEKELLLNKNHNFIILPMVEIEFVSNGYVTFVGWKVDFPFSYADIEMKSINAEVYQTHKYYCNSEIETKRTLPEQLHFSSISGNEELEKIISKMNYMSLLLLLHYLANASDEKKYYIRGYKNITINSNQIDVIDLADDTLSKALEIYKSVYENHTQDKLLIARNVISIYVETDTDLAHFIDKLPDIFNSIHSNIDGYVRDKIKSFFDKKKDLEKYVRDTSESISKQISSVSDNIGKTFLTLIGALIAGLITYTAKGDTWIFVMFVLLFGLVSYMSLHFSIKLAEKEKVLIKDTFDHFVKLTNELSESDKSAVIGTVVNEKLNLLEDTIDSLKVFKQAIFVISSFLGFFLALYMLSK